MRQPICEKVYAGEGSVCIAEHCGFADADALPVSRYGDALWYSPLRASQTALVAEIDDFSQTEVRWQVVTCWPRVLGLLRFGEAAQRPR